MHIQLYYSLITIITIIFWFKIIFYIIDLLIVKNSFKKSISKQMDSLAAGKCKEIDFIFFDINKAENQKMYNSWSIKII